MTSAIQPNAFQQAFGKLNEWTEKRAKTALITSIACAALGIVSSIFVAKVTLVASFALICITGISYCVSTVLFLSYVIRSSAQNEVEKLKAPVESVAIQIQEELAQPVEAINVQITQRPRKFSSVELKTILQETIQDLKNGYYICGGEKHFLTIDYPIENSEYIAPEEPEPRTVNPLSRRNRPENFQTLITVVPKDCLYIAQDLIGEGLDPMLLDVAGPQDYYTLHGAIGIEPEIMRRSGLSIAIDPTLGRQKKIFNRKEYADLGGIYVPRVPVFRAGNDREYEYLETPFTVDVCAVHYIISPDLDNVNGRYRICDNDAANIRTKIRTILHMAHAKNKNAVILEALGCDSHRCPPEHIAQIFKEVIEQEFAHCFEKIVFAIDHDENEKHRNIDPEGNYAPFKRAFPD